MGLGGGYLGYPFSVDAEGYREVIKGHSFKLKEPLQYDVESLFPLLAGVRPQDFPEPRLEGPQAEQALPPPDFPPDRFSQGKRCLHSPFQMELMAWM